VREAANASVGTFSHMAFVKQSLSEGMAGSRLQVPFDAPFPPRGEQLTGWRERVGSGVRSAIFEPLPRGVLVLEVLVGRLGDDLRRSETYALPLKAPVERPAQDGRPLCLELLRQVGVALLRRYLYGERHEQHAAAHGLVGRCRGGAYGSRQSTT
jgi:hypothetical protein